MNYLKVLLLGLAAVCGTLSLASGKIINCYYGSWAHYRQGDGTFRAENIDPNLCTHLSYSFYGIDDVTGAIKSLDPWLTDSPGIGQVAQIMELKKINPKFKVLLVVGGWNECETDKYSRMAASPAMRRNFVTSAERLIREHGFDGLDLDWEYPVVRAGTPADKQNFVILLSEIYKSMKSMGKEFGIAVAASEGTASQAYDIPGIVPNVDFINVMTYDFATYHGRIVGFNAPLAGQGEHNVKSSIEYWMKQGAPISKLVLGLAFYGRTFRLANANQYSIGSPVVGGLEGGPFTGERGFLGYHEICRNINLYSNKWSAESSVPYLHRGTEFISHDNVKSLELKVDYANSLNLAGVLIWSIETDDFHNRCGGGKFPLLNAINKRLADPNGPSTDNEEGDIPNETESPYEPEVPTAAPPPSPPPPSPPPPTPLPPPPPPSPPPPDSSGDCADGLYPHPTDCTKFIQCGNNMRFEKSCPANLHFDVSVGNCNFPDLANCKL